MTDPDVLVAGEALVDLHADSAEPLSAVESFGRRAGGAPANVAVGLARLGRPPWFWTRVGDDPFGEFLLETLRERGVPDRLVERDPDAKTTLAFVGRDDDGEPSFSFYRDGTADTRLRAGAVPDDVLGRVDWVVVGGVALASDPARSAIVDLVERARSRGCALVFDPNARPELWEPERFGSEVDAMIGRVDVVKATTDDLAAAGFEGDDPASLAESVLERGPHTCIVTRGARGAVGISTARAPWGPVSVAHDGYAVDAVDPTGAGDAFLAGAVARLADGVSLEETLAFANAVAALATTEEGAMAALPDRDDVEALVESSSSG